MRHRLARSASLPALSLASRMARRQRLPGMLPGFEEDFVAGDDEAALAGFGIAQRIQDVVDALLLLQLHAQLMDQGRGRAVHPEGHGRSQRHHEEHGQAANSMFFLLRMRRSAGNTLFRGGNHSIDFEQHDCIAMILPAAARPRMVGQLGRVDRLDQVVVEAGGQRALAVVRPGRSR